MNPRNRAHPDDLRVCSECQRKFSVRSAKLGAERCPTCDRRRGNSW